MSAIEISATKRDVQGKGASRRLRHAGRVPGIIYGGEKDPVVVDFDHNEMFHKLRQEAFHASILSLDLDGKKEQVLLRDLQMHPFKQIVMHVDFQRVSKNQKIHMKVPLHFVNADIAPGVKQAGGNVSHILSDLDVSCLPKDLPEFIEVDLATLAAGHSIHISEIKMPNGVESVALSKGDDSPVATIVVPRGVVEEEAVAGAAAVAAPATPAAAA